MGILTDSNLAQWLNLGVSHLECANEPNLQTSTPLTSYDNFMRGSSEYFLPNFSKVLTYKILNLIK